VSLVKRYETKQGELRKIKKIMSIEREKIHNQQKELFALKLGRMTMDEYEKRFLELLKYIGFIKDDMVKIQIFMSGFPSFYSEKIHYYNPWTLEEVLRREKHLYE
jgi:hypothetical protein